LLQEYGFFKFLLWPKIQISDDPTSEFQKPSFFRLIRTACISNGNYKIIVIVTKKIKKQMRSFINAEYNYLLKPERDFILAWAVAMFPLDGSLKDEKHPSAQAYIRFQKQHAKQILQLTPLVSPLLSKLDEIQSMYMFEHWAHDDIFVCTADIDCGYCT
jgi:Gpi18-like mannosyltransferase